MAAHPLLNSELLIARIQKSSSNPGQRLLNAFDLLAEAVSNPIALPGEADIAADSAMLRFMQIQTQAMAIEMPDLLAQQLYFMMQQALETELASPTSRALHHARIAADAMLQAQAPEHKPAGKVLAYAMAAGLFTLLGSTSIALQSEFQPSGPFIVAALNASAKPAETRMAPDFSVANPARTAAMYAKIEQMRTGSCDYPQALVLPESERGIYIEYVVNGKVSTKVSDQDVVNKLLQQVSCNYTPMLMKNSTS
ncbi:hypothetical protein [Methylovorus glucosotrophus]|uniref:Uncharacterized protein n=1 Tax=Methylovorus glucosotrophus (strain SIP3-4) TaxID=582744 RepID=C6X9W6_METGS|nr:hypothetical protein [Methylovorus glucosotrophus]ACT51507.1 conserved hypothetical protein [Methylovorus glucosotrophus SIP3-4]